MVSKLYLGRVVGVGKGKVLFGVSGRGEESRNRKLVIKDEYTVSICPLEEPVPGQPRTTLKQLKKRDRLFYNVIRTGKNRFLGPYAIASDGTGTDVMAAYAQDTRWGPHSTASVLKDKRCTSRITAASFPKHNLDASLLGMVTKNGSGREVDATWTELGYMRHIDPDFPSMKFKWPNRVRYLSTYIGGLNEETGEYDVLLSEPDDVMETAGELTMLGTGAQELAEELYEWMNPELVVGAGAAIFNRGRGKWELGVKNREE
jgi:hypothetical protein